MNLRAQWPSLAILALALVLRIALLGLKPPHFDEGVNGYFVDQITKTGFYHYDPSNFHGPLHFYLLHLAQTLLGRAEWALRLPVTLASTACVALVLAFRAYWSERACRFAALAMAVSPGMVFYGRYAIHETWMLLFLLLTFWGLAGLWRDGTHRALWAVALGITGMVLTKETYLIHLVAMALAVPTLLVLERLSSSQPLPFAGQKWTRDDLRRIVLVCAALVFFFYTGGLMDWSSLPGLWETFAHWIGTGTGEQSGHAKPPWYWLELLATYEQLALLGLLAAIAMLWPRTDRLSRYLAIYGAGTLVAYALVPYKTPWCLIVIEWPFLLLLGLALSRLVAKIGATATAALAGPLYALALGHAVFLNFADYDSESQPYAYVQTRREIRDLIDPLRSLVARDPAFRHLTGYIISPDNEHPLRWLLADFPNVHFYKHDETPEPMDADFLLVDTNAETGGAPPIQRVESQLRENYFTSPLKVRGMATIESRLFLNVQAFSPIFPEREPDFIPLIPEPPEPQPDRQ